MFDHVYKYFYLGKFKGEDGRYSMLHLFRFKTRQNRTIIFQAEIFEEQPIAIVKFSDKACRLSSRRFSMLTGTGGFSAIVWTCISIMFLELAKANPYLSFAFMGAPTPKEMDTTKNVNTHRFRLYRILMRRKFTPLYYEHRVLEDYSCYLILSRDYCREESIVSQILGLIKKSYPEETNW